MGCLHCLPRLPIKTRNYPGPGECNAMNYPYYCFDVITGDFALYRHSLLVAVAARDCFCLSVCFCCMLANKIIDKTNHLRGKSLRPHPTVLGSTVSWLTRNMYETIWRQRKQYKTETKIKQKSQQNVPKTNSLYICIYGIYRNNSIIVTGRQAGYANTTNIPKLQEVHLFGNFNRSEN